MTVTVDDTNLKAIAAAIRAKNGSADTYKPSEMASAIEAIESSDEILNTLINRSVTEINSTAERVGSYAFRDCKSLVSASFPNASRVSSYGFFDCIALAEINFPVATLVDTYSFYGCDSLSKVVFPSVTQAGSYSLASCLALQSVDLPKATYISSNAFYGSCELKSVILRNATMCALANTNAFGNCYHFLGTVNATYNPDGLKDGYIYVPSALVDEYTSNSYWSSFQIRALEDYTVDGTTTGELDESKI